MLSIGEKLQKEYRPTVLSLVLFLVFYGMPEDILYHLCVHSIGTEPVGTVFEYLPNTW